jgi:16S rRNA (guanine527-N7)-methyltransferase
MMKNFFGKKHIIDSLALKYFFEKFSIVPDGLKLLDIGTGGGFPSVPLAIQYPKLKITGLDSIKKKINAVNEITEYLKLKNIKTVCDRAEKIKDKYDIITSRAVASLDKIANYALPLLKKGGYFVAYKALKTNDEIKNSEKVLKKYKAKVVDIIPYDLPLEENHTRNLVIIKI